MSPRTILGSLGAIAIVAFGLFWYAFSRLDAAPAPYTTVEVAGRTTGQGRGPGAQQNQGLREQHSVPMPGQVFQDYARQGSPGQGQQGQQGQGGGGRQWGRRGQGGAGQGYGRQGLGGQGLGEQGAGGQTN